MSHHYNPAGARVGLCGVCGEHFTHEDHYIPITDVKAEEPPLKDPHPDFPNLDRTLMDQHSRRVAAALTKYQHHYDTTEEGYLLHGSGALACSMRALMGDQQEMARYRSERNAARAQLADFIAKVDVALGGEGTADTMSDPIGPDGLTDEERAWRDGARRFPGGDLRTLTALDRLAAERLTHAETRARAEKAEAERDRLRAACAPLLEWLPATLPGAERLGSPGALIGPGQVQGRDVGLTVAQARVLFDALLGEVKP